MKSFLIIFIIISFSISAFGISKTKIIFSDRPVFRIGLDVYYNSDIKTINRAILGLQCLTSKSVLLNLIGYNVNDKTSSLSAIIKMKKIFKYFSVDLVPRYFDNISEKMIIQCDLKLTSREMNELQEVYLYEIDLKRKFRSLKNTRRINSSIIKQLSSFMGKVEKKIQHNVFL